MEAKEKQWLLDRVGYLSASRLDDLMSKGRSKDKLWGDTAINYLYEIERQRWLKEPPVPKFAAPMEFGKEQEPYAVEWLRENVGGIIQHCDQDFNDKIFQKVTWAKFGASPDAFAVNENGVIEALIEIKTVYGEKEKCKYFSPSKPFESKKAMALDEHRAQMAGQLLAYPEVDVIWLVKYDGQSEWEFDLRSTTDISRGIVFRFTRAEFGSYLDEVKDRIIKADGYLDKGLELELINEYYAEFK